MIIPESVKIAGQVMTIKLDQWLASSEDRYGESSSMRGQITLDSTQPILHQQSTLLHEILETINKDNEIGLEHRQITTLATQLHQVITDNPNIFKEG